ncbi:MAG: hypothetical protein LUH43_03400 [Clostridia bacterium]|nr:hypothetical protein [Clostridia bacterium]
MKVLVNKIYNKLEYIFENKLFLMLCALLISFFWAAQCSVSLLYRGESGTDSSVFRYVAYAMSHGQIPYKDIFDHKGPLLYLINYIGYLIDEEIGVWFFEYLALLITTVFIFAISKMFCKHNLKAALTTFASLSLLCLYFEGGNLTEEYAMPLIAISLYIFLDYFRNDKTTRLKLIICGLCGGCVLMLRPNMAVAWLVFPVFILIKQISNKKIKKLLEECILFLAGVVIAIIPFIIYFIYTNSLQDFWNVYLIFNAEYSGSQGSMIGILHSIYSFSNPFLIISIITVLVCIYKRNNLFLNTVYMVFMLMSLLALSISGRQYGHYGMLLIPVVAYPLATLLANYKKNMFSAAALCSSIIIICMTYYVRPTYNLYTHILKNDGVSKTTEEVSDYVKTYTEEEDRILVIGNKDILYLECDRMCASKYSYQLPIANIRTEIYDELYVEIEQNNPAAIIVPVGNEDFYGLENYLYENEYTEVMSNEDYTVYQKTADWR